MDKAVSILWTGGWDSTFRMVELSFQDVDIYPVYVIDPNRKSKDYELKCMDEIIRQLNQKPLTKARIHPVEAIPLADIPKNQQITDAYNLIHAETMLGSQHEWLARLGSIKPGLEMGTEAGTPETSHILHAMQKFAKLTVEDGVGRLDPAASSKEGMLVLGWFTFPIITRTEKDMLSLIRQWGYEDVMKLIWFCHTPKNGKPCGCCHPCEVKVDSDMAFLLPSASVTRCRIWHASRKMLGHRGGELVRKILHKFC